LRGVAGLGAFAWRRTTRFRMSPSKRGLFEAPGASEASFVALCGPERVPLPVLPPGDEVAPPACAALRRAPGTRQSLPKACALPLHGPPRGIGGRPVDPVRVALFVLFCASAVHHPKLQLCPPHGHSRLKHPRRAAAAGRRRRATVLLGPSAFAANPAVGASTRGSPMRDTLATAVGAAHRSHPHPKRPRGDAAPLRHGAGPGSSWGDTAAGAQRCAKGPRPAARGHRKSPDARQQQHHNGAQDADQGGRGPDQRWVGRRRVKVSPKTASPFLDLPASRVRARTPHHLGMHKSHPGF
jgi:hypothetical protein